MTTQMTVKQINALRTIAQGEPHRFSEKMYDFLTDAGLIIYVEWQGYKVTQAGLTALQVGEL